MAAILSSWCHYIETIQTAIAQISLCFAEVSESVRCVGWMIRLFVFILFFSLSISEFNLELYPISTVVCSRPFVVFQCTFEAINICSITDIVSERSTIQRLSADLKICMSRTILSAYVKRQPKDTKKKGKKK